MNYYRLITAISLSLLAATGCKSQNTTATSTVQVLQSGEQANSAESAAVPTSPNGDAAVAEADPNSAKMPPDPTGYVDIADWCRPGMTEPVSAQEWAKANNAFGLKYLAQTKGNTVFSPYSIERALGMTLDGACATTASEMLAALALPNAMRLSISGRDVDDAMKAVNENTTLEIENTLWPDISLTLPDDYLARINAGYRNKIIKLDYSDYEKARQTINDDVAKTTHDRIKDLLPNGSIDSSTELVLTNAVYFKSKWLHQFIEEDTKIETFNNSDKEIKTQIMHAVGGNKQVCIADDYAIYDLEFDSAKEGEKGAYVMRIVLPTINDKHPMEKRMEQLENVERQLSADFTSGCKNAYFDNVYVAVPKFKLAPDTMEIKDILRSMGMKKAFDVEAEFYAMPNATPQPSDPSSYLLISKVFHQAFIEIDEKGGEAAASSAVIMEAQCFGCGGGRDTAQNYYFTVDHPFIYMIMEKSTGAAIFMGRVTDL